MNLPETQNANHLYAFKKGYRLAQEGKLMSQMPSLVKQDPKMREYFQQGWQAFQEELASAETEQGDSPWRSRFAWGMMAILAGIGTASLMIENIQENKSAKPIPTVTIVEKETPKSESIPEADIPPPSAEALSLSLLAPSPKKEAAEPVHQKAETLKQETHGTAPAPSESLGLLNQAARRDLELNKQEATLNNTSGKIEQQPLSTSDIHFPVAVLTDQVKNRKSGTIFDSHVPKHVRNLYFFTQVENAKGQTLYHRWLYKGQVMAIIAMPIKGNLYRTWSSKRLSSAWAGEWQVEVLDADQNPIYRTNFSYIKP